MIPCFSHQERFPNWYRAVKPPLLGAAGAAGSGGIPHVGPVEVDLVRALDKLDLRVKAVARILLGGSASRLGKRGREADRVDLGGVLGLGVGKGLVELPLTLSGGIRLDLVLALR